MESIIRFRLLKACQSSYAEKRNILNLKESNTLCDFTIIRYFKYLKNFLTIEIYMV